MAKTSMVERNNKRRRLAKKFKVRRTRLKAIAADRKLPAEERFAARLKLAELPRNSSPTRIRNRCDLTGPPRGHYPQPPPSRPPPRGRRAAFTAGSACRASRCVISRAMDRFPE